jgi:hypothetical protein
MPCVRDRFRKAPRFATKTLTLLQQARFVHFLTDLRQAIS